MSSYRNTPSPKDGPDGAPDYDVIDRTALTFGFELEFGIASLPPCYEDPNPDNRQVYGIYNEELVPYREGNARRYQSIRNTGISLGLHKPVEIEDWNEKVGIIQGHIARTLNAQGLWALSDDYETTISEVSTAWVVTFDESILFPPLNYQFRDVEVTSPPFYYSKKALQEVKVVCETLPSTYRLVSNTSCSIHVHVGNGIRGFTVAHIQKLMALLWAFEPQLDSLHPQHRVGPTRYSSSLRTKSRLALQLQDENKNAKDGLQRIFDTENIRELVKLLGSSELWRKMAYKISNLVPEDKGHDSRTKKTIEFRQHEGTFDAEAAQQWISLCVHLVEFAEEVKLDRLRDWLEEHIDTDYNVIQILEATKQPLAAWYYEKKLAERSARGPDTSERITQQFSVKHLEETMVTDYIRDLGSRYIEKTCKCEDCSESGSGWTAVG